MHRVVFGAAFLLSLPLAAEGPQLPTDEPVGRIETVATFDGPMPTGVTVSHKGRIFVNFPRWGDKVDFTVAELKGGKPVAFPDAEINRFSKDKPTEGLISVQSVVIDPDDRLWMLDTGSVEFGPTIPGGPKLVGVDLKTNKVFQTVRFPRDVALETTYLNDVRFDLRRGKAGVAYITDSSLKGPNGLIVVDLATGKSKRRLNDHSSTRPDKDFMAIVEGKVLMNRPPKGEPAPLTIGSDGIALSHDGKQLYYCPLASRRLYRVGADALLDEKRSDADLGTMVDFMGDRGFASDGLESDDKGRLYLTDYEHNSIMRWSAEGGYETLVHDPRVLWPDTLSLATDGFLYFTANQLHRQKQFHKGKDLRKKPYALFRVRVDAGPVLLRRAADATKGAGAGSQP